MSNNKYYDELMLNCLRCSNWHKSSAINLFLGDFKGVPWMQKYVYVVYDRVIAQASEEPAIKKMVGEMAANLMAAATEALDRGMKSGNFEEFREITNLQIKASGLDKIQINQVNNQQNNILGTTQAPEEIRERIDALRSKFGIGTTGIAGTGGVRELPSAESIVDIPVSQETRGSAPVNS